MSIIGWGFVWVVTGLCFTIFGISLGVEIYPRLKEWEEWLLKKTEQ